MGVTSVGFIGVAVVAAGVLLAGCDPAPSAGPPATTQAGPAASSAPPAARPARSTSPTVAASRAASSPAPVRTTIPGPEITLVVPLSPGVTLVGPPFPEPTTQAWAPAGCTRSTGDASVTCGPATAAAQILTRQLTGGATRLPDFQVPSSRYLISLECGDAVGDVRIAFGGKPGRPLTLSCGREPTRRGEVIVERGAVQSLTVRFAKRSGTAIPRITIVEAV